ncbi:hypothetical protein ACIQMV_37830 [Streptomyces sp. NPDC091412]|uniref:hypothetical protein n=1 Tax=Streptomyces sp. NPDC091412 TaxID=3366002 RepID=UPI00380C2B43
MADDPRYQAPLGHSVASHRVHGWCSHCTDHYPVEEMVAWRHHENDRYEVAKHTVTPAPETGVTVAHERPCPECGREALMVVTAQVRDDDGPRPAGGWAVCLHCDALPHPRWEHVGLIAADERVRALHVDDFGGCAHCNRTREDFVPYPCPTITALDEAKEPGRG